MAVCNGAVSAGRRRRPAAAPDGDAIVFFPITTKQPEASRFAVEIPAMEKRRAGLDLDLRLWLVLDEYNIDTVGRPFYPEPDPPLGTFSKAFFAPLAREFVARRRLLKGVSRLR